MAKDIGDLTLRVDNIESGLVDRVNALDEDFTNTANVVFKQKTQIKELQTALKALQEEVKCLVEGAPPKDPENWYKIDLGYPLKPIYIRKVQ
jgi:hypothetical protein